MNVLAKKRKRSLNFSLSSSSSIKLDTTKLPAHVAIIMDGNGRWAKKRLLNRINGHEKGSETVRTIVKTCRQIGISYLTLYAFSTENWQRPKAEVEALMALLKKFLQSEQKEMVENNIRLRVIGDTSGLPGNLQQEIERSERATANNDRMTLMVAANYGGRWDITQAARRLAERVAEGELASDDVTMTGTLARADDGYQFCDSNCETIWRASLAMTACSADVIDWPASGTNSELRFTTLCTSMQPDLSIYVMWTAA